jgi:hypothetical protein
MGIVMNSLRPDRDILRGSPLRSDFGIFTLGLHSAFVEGVQCKAVLPRPVLRHTRYSRLNPIKANAELYSTVTQRRAPLSLPGTLNVEDRPNGS